MKKISLILVGLGVVLAGCSSSTEVATNTTTKDVSETGSEQASAQVEESSAEFIWPEAEGELTGDMDTYDEHNGIDIQSELGADVLASAAGTVSEAGFDKLGDGYYVIIDHENGKQTKYSHLTEDLQVAAGDIVSQGDVIGYEGDSGSVTEEHLHFEVSIDGEIIDPLTVVEHE